MSAFGARFPLSRRGFVNAGLAPGVKSISQWLPDQSKTLTVRVAPLHGKDTSAPPSE